MPAIHSETSAGNSPARSRWDVFTVVFVVEAALLVLIGIFVSYDSTADVLSGPQDDAVINTYYPMFQDIHVMIFIGFGFLMSFLRLYGYGAIALTLLLGCIAIQWAILVIPFWNQVLSNNFQTIPLNLESFVYADFATAAFLISFGAVIGKVTPIQLVFMVIIEIALYALNGEILNSRLQVADVGGSITIHVFGAYFGLAVALVTGKRSHKDHKENSATYHSNLFSLIGTVFLWLYWPSFNAEFGGATGNGRHRAVLNTLLSITSSSIVAFACSRLFRGGRFEIVDIQNATLAGGVAMGASAFMRTGPWPAMLVGVIAGFISTGGFALLQPRLAKWIRLYDTCGVHNLHGMPGIIGGLASAIFASQASSSTYGSALTAIFPGCATRSASTQALYQLAGLATTLGIAISGGLITGIILKFFPQTLDGTLFSDEGDWIVPEEEIPLFFSSSLSHSSMSPSGDSARKLLGRVSKINVASADA